MFNCKPDENVINVTKELFCQEQESWRRKNPDYLQ